LKILRQQPLPAYGVFTRAELLLRVQAQQNSEAGLATQSLQTWLADHPRDAGAWQQLATIYAAQGRVVGAIRAQAEVNVSQLDYPAALTRLKAAQEMVRKRGVGADHIEASIVDTRTRQVEAIVREQLLER
jgi:predicted Zn-dependent protease